MLVPLTNEVPETEAEDARPEVADTELEGNPSVSVSVTVTNLVLVEVPVLVIVMVVPSVGCSALLEVGVSLIHLLLVGMGVEEVLGI